MIVVLEVMVVITAVVLAAAVSSLILNIDIISVEVFSTKLNYGAQNTVLIIAKHFECLYFTIV
jgi:hypothetical protein